MIKSHFCCMRSPALRFLPIAAIALVVMLVGRLPAYAASASDKMDISDELSACEDMARMMQPETRKHCQEVVDRAEATPRQHARALTRLAYIAEHNPNSGFDDFMVILAKAIRADPSYPAPRLARANFLIMGNKSGEAMDQLKAVLDIDPHNAEAFLGIGRIHSYLGQLDLAYDEMTKAMDLGIAGPDAYYYRGFVLEQAGRFLAAAKDYSKAQERYDPMHRSLELTSTGDPVIHLARALKLAERPDLLVGALAGVGDRRLPDYEKSQLLAQRAEANEKIGKFADAAKDMNAAIRLATPDKQAALRVRQSEMLQHAGHGDEATSKITEALDGADLRTVLQVQVFLRNHGYADVEITGKMDAATHRAAMSCFSKPECGSGISHFI